METPFFRPEATAWIARWRETLAGAGLAALGLWWFATGGGLLVWAGAVLALGGGAAAVAAFQRARFRAWGGGAGVVQLDEGRLNYFGPLSGGSVAVRDIASVGIDPRHRPAHWVIADAQSVLLIPVDAEGTVRLFDAFAQLPGLDPGKVVAASERRFEAPTILWRRPGLLPARQG